MGFTRNQMFPRKYLEAEDYAAAFPTGAVVTITGIDYMTRQASKPGEAEIDYFLTLREFRKPLRLKAAAGLMLFDILGENTDNWIGRTIRLSAMSMQIFGQAEKRMIKIYVFDVDIVLPTGPSTLPPSMDIAGTAQQSRQFAAAPKPAGFIEPPAAKSGTLGMETAALIVLGLRERGKVWSDLVEYCKANGLNHLISGLLPPDCPADLGPYARKFCLMFPKSAAFPTPAELNLAKAKVMEAWRPPPPPPASPEVINPTTGEVVHAGPYAHPGAVGIENDDTPF